MTPITNQITTTHNQQKESLVWQKTVDSGSVETTAQLPKFNQTPTITAPNGVVVQVPVEVTVNDNNQAKNRINRGQEDLGKIAIQLSKQSGFEYLADLEKRGDINWQQVELIQKNWNYKQEGLTPGAAALIALAVTIATGGADGGQTGALLTAGNAAMSTLATQATITLINNKGDINATLRQLASSATVRGMATSALTAGLTQRLGLTNWDNSTIGDKISLNIAEGMTNAFVDVAINGSNLEDALTYQLREALVDAFAAQTFTDFVKDYDNDDLANNLSQKLVASGVGCIAASAKNQSCDAGAIGAAIGEMVADYIIEPGFDDDYDLVQQQQIINTSKVIAGTVALLAGVDVNSAASSAELAVKYNAADFAESKRRHEAALQQRVAELKKLGYTKFQYDVRITVPLPKGRPATRVIDIVAMKPNQNLVTGRYEEIKSTISDAGVRRVNRKTSPTRIIEMASKASRGIEISNQVITDYYLNVNGATIQSTGQKIKPNAQEMHWSVWKFKNRTDKTGTRVGGVIPIIDPTQTKDMIINNLP